MQELVEQFPYIERVFRVASKGANAWALEIFRKYGPFSHLPNRCQENEKGQDPRVTLSLGVSNSFVRT